MIGPDSFHNYSNKISNRCILRTLDYYTNLDLTARGRTYAYSYGGRQERCKCLSHYEFTKKGPNPKRYKNLFKRCAMRYKSIHNVKYKVVKKRALKAISDKEVILRRLKILDAKIDEFERYKRITGKT